MKIMKTLGLISCTKLKQTYQCKACEMYLTSKLFEKAYSFARKNYDIIAILSAKHGLLLPDDEIMPYDETLNNQTSQQRRLWAKMTFDQLQNKININEIETIYFHAGQKYRQYLIPKVEALGILCLIPLKGLRIGEQLAWYNERLV